MAAGVSLIVGLGNPGAEYEKTRHNVGFWFVDRVAQRAAQPFRVDRKFHGEICKVTLGGQNVWLLKPQTYMNRSGQAVSALAAYYDVSVENILVVHDELDLEPGVARLKLGGGHGGHNGLRSIISSLGGPGFQRLRLGIGHPGERDEVVNYVLHTPSKLDQDLIEQGIENALGVLDQVVEGQLQIAMNKLHSLGRA